MENAQICLVRVGGPGFVSDEEGFYHEWVSTTVEGVSDLPTGKQEEGLEGRMKPRPGSLCSVTANGAIYELSPARSWEIVVEGIL